MAERASLIASDWDWRSGIGDDILTGPFNPKAGVLRRMGWRIFRSCGAVGAGLATGFLLTIAVEAFSAVVHPVPPGVDLRDIEACRAHVARYPAWVLAVVVVTWGTITMIAAWLATWLGTRRHPAHGYFIAAVLVALVVLNMSMLPYPSWFWCGNLAALPLGGWAGTKLGRGLGSAVPESTALLERQRPAGS